MQNNIPNVPRDQRIWNALAMVGFIAVFAAAFFYVVESWNVRELENLGWFDIFVIALAAQRLTRLVTNDKISGFVREWFLDSDGNGGYDKPRGGFRRLMAELIECVWCTSMWAGLFALVFYLVGPIGKFGVLLLAISTLAMIGYNCSLALANLGSK